MHSKQKQIFLLWVQKCLQQKMKSKRKQSKKRRSFLVLVLSSIRRFHNQKFRLLLLEFLHHENKRKIHRSVWCYPRQELWFSHMWSNRFVENFEGGRWQADFRTSVYLATPEPPLSHPWATPEPPFDHQMRITDKIMP